MFEIYDINSGLVLLDGFTTTAAAKKAAFRIFPDRMWSVRITKADQ